jgi:hypothetical protein
MNVIHWNVLDYRSSRDVPKDDNCLLRCNFAGITEAHPACFGYPLMIAPVEFAVFPRPVAVAGEIRYDKVTRALRRLRDYDPKMGLLNVEIERVAELYCRHWINAHPISDS